jgi:hypothetical protein
MALTSPPVRLHACGVAGNRAKRNGCQRRPLGVVVQACHEKGPPRSSAGSEAQTKLLCSRPSRCGSTPQRKYCGGTLGIAVRVFRSQWSTFLPYPRKSFRRDALDEEHLEETRKTRKAKFDATAVAGKRAHVGATIAVIACYAGEAGSRRLPPPTTNRGNAEPL